MNIEPNVLWNRRALALASALLVVFFWTFVAVVNDRFRDRMLQETSERSMAQAQLLAEYGNSTIKRADELLVSLREDWKGDWAKFADIVRKRQTNIRDLTFQVAMMDAQGIMTFSNLSVPSDRTDLSDREHFKVHRDSGGVDRLFISKPLLGKVSRKWSVQFTRPIYVKGNFGGVMVLSVDPARLVNFAGKLKLGPGAITAAISDEGIMIGRFPEDLGALGKKIPDRPYMRQGEADAGTYRLPSFIDGGDRIFGYYRLREYGINFVAGVSVDEALAPFQATQRVFQFTALLMTLLVAAMYFYLSRSMGRLDSTRKQLRTILDLSPDGIVSIDGGNRVAFRNAAFSRMFGMDDAEPVGMSFDLLREKINSQCGGGNRFSLGPNKDGDLMQEDIEVVQPKRLDVRVISKAGVADVLDVFYFQDQSKERELERLKSQFLSTAAHELRTPMASILGFAEVLVERRMSAEEQREFLQIIFSQASLVSSIINELLDLVRIEERRGADFKYESIEVEPFLQEVVASFSVPLDRPPPQVVMLPGVEPVRADRSKAARALANVLSNAYKYSSGSETVSIRVLRREAQEGRLAMIGIEVTDQGMGMSPDELKMVGTRFWRADSSGTVPGTGLGLSIVRELLRLMKGGLDIESEIGVGTTATLWFPASATVASAAAR